MSKRTIVFPIAALAVVGVVIWMISRGRDIPVTTGDGQSHRGGAENAENRTARTEPRPPTASSRMSDISFEELRTGSAATGQQPPLTQTLSPAKQGEGRMSPPPKITLPSTTSPKPVRPVFTKSGSSELIYVEPGQQVALTVDYPDAAPGDTILAQAMDGGEFVKAEVGNKPGVQVLKLDEQRTAGATFAVGNNPGLYQVVLRQGLKTKVVQLWAGPPLAVAAQ